MHKVECCRCAEINAEEAALEQMRKDAAGTTSEPLREFFEQACTAEPLAEGWQELEKFGLAVVDACAKICEKRSREAGRLRDATGSLEGDTGYECAEAIRARFDTNTVNRRYA